MYFCVNWINLDYIGFDVSYNIDVLYVIMYNKAEMITSQAQRKVENYELLWFKAIYL